jgi:hypothetical protein
MGRFRRGFGGVRGGAVRRFFAEGFRKGFGGVSEGLLERRSRELQGLVGEVGDDLLDAAVGDHGPALLVKCGLCR